MRARLQSSAWKAQHKRGVSTAQEMELRAGVVLNKYLPKLGFSVVFPHCGSGLVQNTDCTKLGMISASAELLALLG